MQYLGTIDKAKDIINKDFVEKLLGDYQPLINESSKLPYSLISGVPTSLPASDVYPWAKASTKPSYSYSEITGAISTTELQNYLTSNSYLNVTGGDNRYLRLSGGTITGNVTLKAALYGENYILWKDPETTNGGYFYGTSFNASKNYTWTKRLLNWNVDTGVIDFSQTPTVNGNSVWHSGNDGSGSGLDADLLDGQQGSWYQGNIHSFARINYTSSSVHDANVAINGMLYNYGSNTYWRNTPDMSYGQILTLKSYGSNELMGQLAWDICHGKSDTTRYLWWRAIQNESTISNAKWHQIAFTDSNVASADALKKTWTEEPNYATGSNAVKIISNTTGSSGNYATGYSSGLSVISSYVGWQLMSDGGNVENPYFRSLQDNGNWKPWRKLAFIDDNVASATKLQTARTIWGQSFDGTGNIDGLIDIITAKQTTSTISSGSCAIRLGSNGSGHKGYHAGIAFSALRYNAYTNHIHAWIGLGSFTTTSVAECYPLIFATNSNTETNTSPIERMRITPDGNVGIGTANPSAKLEVNGITHLLSDLDVKGYLYTSGLVYLGANSDGIYLHATGINFHNSSNGWVASCVTFDGNGNMNALHNLLVNGGITMYSDQRKKTILNHVELSLKQIAEAPLIEHYYNGDDKKTTHVGSIAQYWASMNDWFCKLDSEGFYTMEIQNAALASAISIARELDRYETKTDKAIKKLKKRICELEEEVERLKAS